MVAGTPVQFVGLTRLGTFPSVLMSHTKTRPNRLDPPAPYPPVLLSRTLASTALLYFSALNNALRILKCGAGCRGFDRVSKRPVVFNRDGRVVRELLGFVDGHVPGAGGQALGRQVVEARTKNPHIPAS